MSGPHVALDPDPLVDPLWRAELEGEWFDRGYAAAESDRRWRRAGILLAAASGLVLGIVMTSLVWVAYTRAAAPRSAQTTERVDVSAPSSAGLIGAPRDGMPVESARTTPAAVVAAPVASVGAPQPTGEISAIQAGTATWCAPTPTHCQSWGGDAHLGAMHSFRFGDQPYQVTVRFGDRSTTVTVVSYCSCGITLIDLSPAAFAELAPLSRGRIDVTVEDASGGSVTAPPTDVEP